MTDSENEITIAPRSERFAGVVINVLLPLGIALGFVLLGARSSRMLLLAIPPLLLFALWLSLRITRTKLCVDDQGIEIVNTFRRYEWDWRTVDRIGRCQPWISLLGGGQGGLRVEGQNRRACARASVRLARRDPGALQRIYDLAQGHGIAFDVDESWLRN